MECSICYEKFIISVEEFDVFMNSVDRKNINKFMKFQNLFITKRNKPVICCIDTCKSIFCYDCITNIRMGGNIMDMTQEELDKIDHTTITNYKCPFCRNIDWKNYMKIVVLNQLQNKILTDDEYYKQLWENMTRKFGDEIIS